MKIVLMVAAGVAVGMTVVLAMVVQIVVGILDQLMPLLVALAVVMLVLKLVRRRNAAHRRPADHLAPFRYPVATPTVAPTLWTPAPREVEPAPLEPYLRWGPPAQEDYLAAPVATLHAAVPHIRRSSAGSSPSRVVRGRRP